MRGRGASADAGAFSTLSWLGDLFTAVVIPGGVVALAIHGSGYLELVMALLLAVVMAGVGVFGLWLFATVHAMQREERMSGTWLREQQRKDV